MGNEGSRETDYMAKKQSSHCGCCCERLQVARTVHGSCPSLALSVEAVRTTAAYFQTQLSPMVWCTFLTREKLALWYAAFDLQYPATSLGKRGAGGEGRRAWLVMCCSQLPVAVRVNEANHAPVLPWM